MAQGRRARAARAVSRFRIESERTPVAPPIARAVGLALAAEHSSWARIRRCAPTRSRCDPNRMTASLPTTRGRALPALTSRRLFAGNFYAAKAAIPCARS